MRPHDIVDLGIAQVPEGRRIFSRLTVEENLRLGAHANEKGKHFNTDVKEVYDLFPVLNDRKSQRGGTLIRRRTTDVSL
jgi:branched-chain amino acid transport system ATP-binding protein